MNRNSPSDEDDTEPVLIVGWDGAPFSLINDLIDRGDLPVLESIAENGYFGPLNTVPYVMSSCAWSTFITGKNAGKHGIYDFYADDFREQSYFRNPINSTARDSNEIGHILNRHGKRIGKLNVPMTFPASNVNKFTVTGMLTPSKQSDGFCHPENFLSEFEELDRYRIDSGEGKDADRDEFLSEIEHIVESRFEIALYAIEKEQVDVFFVVFTSPDRLSHYYYHFYDKNHPFRKNESNADLEKYADAIPNLFKNLDSKLGEIKHMFESEYGKEPLTAVVSDHGMESLDRILHVNKWLSNNGYLEFKDGVRDTKSTVSRKTEEVLDERVEYIFGNVNWENTQAYSVGKRGAIYINQKGREPEGLVPNSERDQVIGSLIDDLSSITDPETGKEIIESVHTRDEIFHGPHVEEAPDILLSLTDGYYPFGYAFALEKTDIISTNDWSHMPFVTGIESGPGILAIEGEKISSTASEIDAGLKDFLPTLLHYLNLSVPKDMDGQVLQEILIDDQLQEITFEDSRKAESTDTDSSESDQQAIKDRLKDLGYL